MKEVKEDRQDYKKEIVSDDSHLTSTMRLLIVWLLSITEHHCINTPNSNSLFTQLHKKSSYEIRNCFIFKVGHLGLEPRTSRL